MKITKFNNENLEDLRTIIDFALTTELKKFGLSASLGSITYSDNDFKIQLKVVCGSAEDGRKREWDKWAVLFGLDNDDFGSLFTSKGQTFEVTGIAPKSRKYPILATNDAGVEYKFTVNVLKK